MFRSTCPTCLGGSLDCAACEGVGKKEWHRCPASFVTRDVWQLLDSYTAYDAHHVLPAPGGWMDQARAWAQWVRIIESERGVIEEENRPRSKKTE